MTDEINNNIPNIKTNHFDSIMVGFCFVLIFFFLNKMKQLLITVIILVCLSVIALVVMSALYMKRYMKCTLAIYRYFSGVVLALGVDVSNVDNPSMRITLHFTDLVAPKPLYYLVVYRVNASQFITREILPSMDGFHHESVPVSYLVDPSLFEAQITRIESDGMRVESQILRIEPMQAMEALKPMNFSRTTIKQGVVTTSGYNNTKKKIEQIKYIDIDELMDKKETPGFGVGVTIKYALVFASTLDKVWYTLTDEVWHWDICKISDHVVYTNSDGIVYILDLKTREVEPVIKLDCKDDTIDICLLEKKCILTMTTKHVVIFIQNHGVWTRIVEMIGDGFTGIDIKQITKYFYSMELMQSHDKSTKYSVDIDKKIIIKQSESKGAG